ncbi:hypothetical protein BDY17DRAFT_298130 [Neohortaea acidophila]|uniref:Glucose-methanol-choline oxidoreductase N-terminal domain-containing protein n=1 Tax=Neohortaea acidophila TaxID=245834 RepID=A0A6A6PRW2_9PEZI|nr:uncharacterized protein BDY17DRAFT_298130 [Neohortaea acidophila]KAF2482213.1 hypothetical protein BDY17DRAFT_298130 [Neohortaea acidophila]
MVSSSSSEAERAPTFAHLRLHSLQTGEMAEEYDIVIVGAGTAGCVLANRLSEDPSISVLILEAGQDRNDDKRVATPVPGQLVDNPEFDWQYVSEPQHGINGRRMKQPRGKVLGGSSVINSFALIYPSRAGMDVWADLGNKGWDWEGTKDYFRKFQTVCPAPDIVKRELRPVISGEGTNGPIQASYPFTVSQAQRLWLQAFKSLGLENTSDPLDGAAIGGHITTNHISIDKRERSHAGLAYYEPVRGRPNLKLVTGALVQNITFDTSSGNDALATGVAYIKDGISCYAAARKEILLAAGAFATPQILELSGIGDSTSLQRHGIATVYDNPNVGENLQDHIRPGLSFEVADSIGSRDPLPPSDAQKLYESDSKGPWVDRACYTFAYMPLHHFMSSAEKQELSNILDEHLNDRTLPEFQQKRNAFIKQMILSPFEASATAFFARRPAGTDSTQGNFFTFLAMLSHPFSQGSCHIASSDAAAKPRIDPGYYTHPLDLEVHARHIQTLVKLTQTQPFADAIKADGAQVPIKFTDISIEQAKEFIKEYATTNYHPCGTCSMMPEQIGGVVDDRLRVYGTRNVRVVDASIMPIIPRGNILTTVFAVAEKAADIISGDLGIKRTT